MLLSIYNHQCTDHGKRTKAEQIHYLRFIDINASLRKENIRKAEYDKIEQVTADDITIEISSHARLTEALSSGSAASPLPGRLPRQL